MVGWMDVFMYVPMVALPPNFTLLKRRKGTDRVVMLGEMVRTIIDDSGNAFAIGEKNWLKMELEMELEGDELVWGNRWENRCVTRSLL